MNYDVLKSMNYQYFTVLSCYDIFKNISIVFLSMMPILRLKNSKY